MARQRPEVVLLELLVARTDAFGVIEPLQQDPRYRQIPVIAFTTTTLTSAERAVRGQSLRTVLRRRDRSAMPSSRHCMASSTPTLGQYQRDEVGRTKARSLNVEGDLPLLSQCFQVILGARCQEPL
jgi:CheY-like chemotaxis protein